MHLRAGRIPHRNTGSGVCDSENTALVQRITKFLGKKSVCLLSDTIFNKLPRNPQGNSYVSKVLFFHSVIHT